MGTITYHFNALDRLSQIDGSDGRVIEYAYNHQGIRFAKWIDGVETGYLIDSNRPYAQVLEEYSGVDLSALYVYGDDLISQHNGEWKYFLYDGQLSTRQLVDNAGVVTDSYDYDGFGEMLSSSGSSTNNYLYTGEQFDGDAGFYYLRARYYDQSSGRFLGMDPYGGSMHEPMTLHRYLYAGDNPVMNVDPSGEMSIGSLMAGITVRNMLISAGIGAAISTPFAVANFSSDIAEGKNFSTAAQNSLTQQYSLL